MLYGRGAADMKSAIAAFVAAVARDGPAKGSISLLITGDEEGAAVNGTVKLLEWLKARGEKHRSLRGGRTDLRGPGRRHPKMGRRGSINFTLHRQRRAGPCRLSAKGQEPDSGVADVVTQLAAHKLDKGNDHFDPSTLAFTTIDVGNDTTNVIPGEARAAFNIRFNDKHTPQSLNDWVRTAPTACQGKRDAPSGHAQTSGVVPDPAGEIHPTDQRHGGRHHRPVALLFHQRRHFGCALHQGSLPGGGTRPGGRDHAQGRRMRAGGEIRRFDRYLRSVLLSAYFAKPPYLNNPRRTR